MAIVRTLDWDFAEEDVTYTLLAMHSTIEPYRMAYFLNAHLNMQFYRTLNDHVINTPSYTTSYPIFKYENIYENVSFHLLPNKFKGTSKTNTAVGLFQNESHATVKTTLITEFKNVDYILKISVLMGENEKTTLLQKILKIPHVLSSYYINTKIKQQDYLIFE